MELTKEQVDYISSHILINDVLAHIEKTRPRYEEFLKQEKLKEQQAKKKKGNKNNDKNK